MSNLRKNLICSCCKGSGVLDKNACQAYKPPTWSGKIFQCNIEGRYELDGVYYCGSHLKQELRKQKRLNEYESIVAKKPKLQQFMKEQNG